MLPSCAMEALLMNVWPVLFRTVMRAASRSPAPSGSVTLTFTNTLSLRSKAAFDAKVRLLHVWGMSACGSLSTMVQLTERLCGQVSWLLTTLKFAEKVPLCVVVQLNLTFVEVSLRLPPFVKFWEEFPQLPAVQLTVTPVLLR